MILPSVCKRFLRDTWEDDTEGKRLVIQSILNSLQVFPVSAPQYRLHCSKDSDEDKPFLADAESTNIPALRLAISKIAQQCLADQSQRYKETSARFFGQLRARLEVLSAQGSEERQAEGEVNKFKHSLESFMAPLQREFDTRRGGFRNFLRQDSPNANRGSSGGRVPKARKAIHGDMRGLQDAHWKTLASSGTEGRNLLRQSPYQLAT